MSSFRVDAIHFKTGLKKSQTPVKIEFFLRWTALFLSKLDSNKTSKLNPKKTYK